LSKFLRIKVSEKSNRTTIKNAIVKDIEKAAKELTFNINFKSKPTNIIILDFRNCLVEVKTAF